MKLRFWFFAAGCRFLLHNVDIFLQTASRYESRERFRDTSLHCIIMGDFNHGNIKWDSLQSTGVEDQRCLCLVQDNFLTQHVLEPTRAARVLDIDLVLSSQKEFVDNVVIQEPLGSRDHNQLHFNINIKSDKTKVKQCRRDFRKGNYIRKLGKV